MKKIISMIVVIILITACKKSSTSEPTPTAPLKDIDGNEYDIVKIGTQFWMKQNLNTTRYRNGDSIQYITNSFAWSILNTGAWCWYNNDSATYAATYGKLYNWYAVYDARGLSPAGWHVPIEAEWATISTVFGGDVVAGGAMKETGLTHWTSPNTGATNSSGFTALPGGFRNDVGQFFLVGNGGYWWSSHTPGEARPWNRVLLYDNAVSTNALVTNGWGFSVRCLKD